MQTLVASLWRHAYVRPSPVALVPAVAFPPFAYPPFAVRVSLTERHPLSAPVTLPFDERVSGLHHFPLVSPLPSTRLQSSYAQ